MLYILAQEDMGSDKCTASSEHAATVAVSDTTQVKWMYLKTMQQQGLANASHHSVTSHSIVDRCGGLRNISNRR